MPQAPLIIDLDIALAKAAKYCAYQERCQQELRQRLQQWNVDGELHEEIIARMISENFIDEERFAMAFVSGKHRIKHWGRYKIRHALRAKGISDYSIGKAMRSIEEEAYVGYLRDMIERYQVNKGIKVSVLPQKQKLINYFVNKGYELELILRCVEDFNL